MNPARDFWQRQTDKPLFPELEWSRPELKSQAGKLLIIGGNSGAFSEVAAAYETAEKVGIGSCRVLLPDSLKKVVGSLFPGEFAPSNPSGGFARKATAEMLDNANWADGILLTGDIGHNSETVIAIDTFINKFKGQVSLTGQTYEALANTTEQLLARPNTTIVLDLKQLQKFYKNSHQTSAITSDIDLLNLVDSLHEFTIKYAVSIVLGHDDLLLVASNGDVSTTSKKLTTGWQIKTAAGAGVWWLQNPAQTFKAITTGIK